MRSKTILIADDEPEILALVKDELLASGYEVISCVTANEMLRLLQEGLLPMGILVDLIFPDMKVDDMIRNLLSRVEQSRIVLVSGRLDIEEWAKKYGISKTLSKPFHVDELLEAVRSFK